MCYGENMLKPKTLPAYPGSATRIHPEMPNHVGSEAELLAALAEGDADIEAGRTVSFEEVAAELRGNYGKA